MSVIDNIKDSARKAANKVIDTAEEIVNKPKSPKELATRLIEHLSHQEYAKIATILSEEAKKYASHLGLTDFPLIEAKLDDFKNSMGNLAGNLEDGDYSGAASKIKQVESKISEEAGGNSEIFTSLKSLLQEIAKVLEDKAKKVEGDAEHDLSKLRAIFENYFTKMVIKTVK